MQIFYFELLISSSTLIESGVELTEKQHTLSSLCIFLKVYFYIGEITV